MLLASTTVEKSRRTRYAASCGLKVHSYSVVDQCRSHRPNADPDRPQAAAGWPSMHRRLNEDIGGWEEKVMEERKRCAEIAWSMQRAEGRSEIGNAIMQLKEEVNPCGGGTH
jgi:hypothetical protein